MRILCHICNTLKPLIVQSQCKHLLFQRQISQSVIGQLLGQVLCLSASDEVWSDKLSIRRELKAVYVWWTARVTMMPDQLCVWSDIMSDQLCVWSDTMED